MTENVHYQEFTHLNLGIPHPHTLSIMETGVAFECQPLIVAMEECHSKDKMDVIQTHDIFIWPLEVPEMGFLVLHVRCGMNKGSLVQVNSISNNDNQRNIWSCVFSEVAKILNWYVFEDGIYYLLCIKNDGMICVTYTNVKSNHIKSIPYEYTKKSDSIYLDVNSIVSGSLIVTCDDDKNICVNVGLAYVLPENQGFLVQNYRSVDYASVLDACVKQGNVEPDLIMKCQWRLTSTQLSIEKSRNQAVTGTCEIQVYWNEHDKKCVFLCLDEKCVLHIIDFDFETKSASALLSYRKNSSIIDVPTGRKNQFCMCNIDPQHTQQRLDVFVSKHPSRIKFHYNQSKLIKGPNKTSEIFFLHTESQKKQDISYYKIKLKKKDKVWGIQSIYKFHFDVHVTPLYPGTPNTHIGNSADTSSIISLLDIAESQITQTKYNNNSLVIEPLEILENEEFDPHRIDTHDIDLRVVNEDNSEDEKKEKETLIHDITPVSWLQDLATSLEEPLEINYQLFRPKRANKILLIVTNRQNITRTHLCTLYVEQEPLNKGKLNDFISDPLSEEASLTSLCCYKGALFIYLDALQISHMEKNKRKRESHSVPLSVETWLCCGDLNTIINRLYSSTANDKVSHKIILKKLQRISNIPNLTSSHLGRKDVISRCLVMTNRFMALVGGQYTIPANYSRSQCGKFSLFEVNLPTIESTWKQSLDQLFAAGAYHIFNKISIANELFTVCGVCIGISIREMQYICEQNNPRSLICLNPQMRRFENLDMPHHEFDCQVHMNHVCCNKREYIIFAFYKSQNEVRCQLLDLQTHKWIKQVKLQQLEHHFQDPDVYKPSSWPMSHRETTSENLSSSPFQKLTQSMCLQHVPLVCTTHMGEKRQHKTVGLIYSDLIDFGFNIVGLDPWKYFVVTRYDTFQHNYTQEQYDIIFEE